MAREIKFRGKTIPDRQWVFGYYVKMENETKTIQRHAIMDVADTDNKFIKSGKNYQMSLSVVDSNTIGQFTGLQDKNGNEIYEGDIVRTLVSRLNATKNKKYRNFVIRYDAPHFWNGYDSILMRPMYMEVIGNIHDNPELLKQED